MISCILMDFDGHFHGCRRPERLQCGRSGTAEVTVSFFGDQEWGYWQHMGNQWECIRSQWRFQLGMTGNKWLHTKNSGTPEQKLGFNL